MELVQINITFTDAPTLSGRFFMTDIPRVGEHIRVALDCKYDNSMRQFLYNSLLPALRRAGYEVALTGPGIQ